MQAKRRIVKGRTGADLHLTHAVPALLQAAQQGSQGSPLGGLERCCGW